MQRVFVLLRACPLSRLFASIPFLFLLGMGPASPPAGAQGFTTLHVFHSGSTEGRYSSASLIQASDGNFYGTSEHGGERDWGTVFKVDVAGNLTTLHVFNYLDGASPTAALMQASDGNFYGTTNGSGPNGYGTIFKIDMAGNVTVLHSFTYSDGVYPVAGLIQANDGKLYGTTSQGGGDPSTNPAGTIFQLDLNLPVTKLAGLSVMPSTVPGCKNATGTITLSAPIALNTVVTLTSTNPAATVPSKVTVLADKIKATFPIKTTPVTTKTTGYIKATLNGVTLSKPLTVRPIGVASVSLSPNPVTSGGTVNGTVTLECPVPSSIGSITVTLRSSNPTVAKPVQMSITISSPAKTGSFTVSTTAGVTGTATIKATANGITKGKKLTVD